MDIPINPPSPLIESGKSTITFDKIQSGQYLYAKVVDQLPNKTDVILRLGNQLVQAKSDVQVSIGQTIKVLVERTPSTLTLKVQTPFRQADIINNTLRNLLPKQTSTSEFQQPLKQVFSSLQSRISESISTPQVQAIELQQTQIKRLAIDIIQALPNHKSIATTDGLKSAVQNSGLFLEPRLQQALTAIKSSSPININSSANSPLSHTKNDITTQTSSKGNIELTRIDLKANLIKLIQILKNWPKPTTQPEAQQKQTKPTPFPGRLFTPITQATRQTAINTPAQVLERQIKELIVKTEGAVSKITLNQLASTNIESNSNTTRQTWQFEIPLFNNQSPESIFIKIESDESGINKQREKEQQWTVSLEMNPPKLGIIKNKLTLTNQKISSSFWADNPETKTLIQEHINILKEQFKRTNLQAEVINVQSGLGPTIQATKPSTSILSEKA